MSAKGRAIDSPLCLELIAQGAAAMHPNAASLLDIGCGAGNWTLKLLQRLPNLSCTLGDLSQPMLDRARERVSAAGARSVTCVQGDVRSCEFADASFDLITAGAVLHHLRSDEEWRHVAGLFYQWLKPGGSVWVYDMVAHDLPEIEAVMHERYRAFLTNVGGEDHAANVFAYIDVEDSPRPVMFQLRCMLDAGFRDVDLLHKNGPFAAYVARK